MIGRFVLFLLIVMTLTSYVIIPIDLDKHEYPTHIKQINGADSGTYPTLIYYFYPDVNMIYIYVFFVIPFLMDWFGRLIGLQDTLPLIIIYYLSLSPVGLLLVGYLKQTIYTIFLLGTFILLESKISNRIKFSSLGIMGLILLYIQPISRTVGALSFKLSMMWYNIPHASIQGFYISFIVLLSTVVYKKWIYTVIFIIMMLLGTFESRIYTTFFIVGLPFFVLLIQDLLTKNKLFLKKEILNGRSTS